LEFDFSESRIELTRFAREIVRDRAACDEQLSNCQPNA